MKIVNTKDQELALLGKTMKIERKKSSPPVGNVAVFAALIARTRIDYQGVARRLFPIEPLPTKTALHFLQEKEDEDCKS